VGEETVIGSNNYLMANAHVGHNSVVGNHVIIANGALLGGHVTVQDRAFISGNCLLHQFTRVGTLALMQGGAGASKDIPPFTIASEVNVISGLNLVGLRRAGFTSEERILLKRLYHQLFRSDLPFRTAVESVRGDHLTGPGKVLIDFVSEARRGVCLDHSRRKVDSGETTD
jgi:UDP-N-acetylglucosamine acyltransferase